VAQDSLDFDIEFRFGMASLDETPTQAVAEKALGRSGRNDARLRSNRSRCDAEC
jgi:hypothetical protein